MEKETQQVEFNLIIRHMTTEKKFSIAKPSAERTKRIIDQLDFGYKKLEGDKLYLSQEEGTVYGAVEFGLDNNIITGPDGTKFDLSNIKYTGPDGIYSYLRKVSGLGNVKTFPGEKDRPLN